MKEALMLLLVLLIWLFTSQSFGYNASTYDTKVLNVIYGKVDIIKLTDPERLTTIHEQFPPLIERFSDMPQENYILTKIFSYIDRLLYPQVASSSTTYSPGLIEALGEMFD